MTPSKILFYFCISFVAGIFTESIIKIPQIFLWAFLFFILLIIFLSLLFNKNKIIIFGFCLFFVVLGIARVQITELDIQNNKLSKLNGSSEMIFEGIVSSEPDVRDTYQKIKVNIQDSTVLILASKYPLLKYLDKLEITGKLETPSETEDFSYKNYLMKDGIYSVMNFPQIEIIGKADKDIFSFVYSNILDFKQKIRESIRSNFSPPQSSILEGTVLGDNGAMSNDLKNKLNITGLRHVIAVSGTHVVILSSIIMSVLLAIGLWRGQAFYLSISFICLYVILVGLPASGVRAGVMGGLYLLAQKLGRQSMGSRIIALACAVMLLINPLLLTFDVGFQLSFLAVMGLIYLEPFIKRFINIFAKQKAENLIGIVATTFAAQIFTLPVMIYNFGNISFVSPITNLLILPTVYWLMIFGFLSSFAGVFFGFLGKILAVPCWFLLDYFVWVIDFFSQPWAIKTIQNIHWIWLLIFYMLLGISIQYIQKKSPSAF